MDGVGRIANIRKDDTAIWYTIHADSAILRYVVEKGSITIDGISLTVAAVEPTGFSVSTIPHTVCQTNLNQRHKGDFVNLETMLSENISRSCFNRKHRNKTHSQKKCCCAAAFKESLG